MDSETKKCQNCRKQFAIEAEDFAFYEKIDVPPPTFCPACRMQRRFMFRNERSLYKRTCDKCKKPIISMMAPELPHRVYCQQCWWSDDWDPLDYGKKYDPSQPFFVQLKELLETTPLASLSVAYTTLVNSDYLNEASYCKNCYLVFNADYCENSSYGTSLSNTKDVTDALLLTQSELCHEVVNCSDCFSCFFSEDLKDCHDVFFSKNLSGCGNCFGCVNLRNKNYYIWNQPYSKEEYAEKMADLKRRMADAKELPGLILEAEKFWLKAPQKYMHGTQNTNVTGEYVSHSKNSKHIYQSDGVEDSKYVQMAKDKPTKDAYDFTVWGMSAERMYEALTCGENVQNVKFCVACLFGAHDTEYSLYCYGGSNIFGCVSTGKRQYCILNKQYSKEEYEKLRGKIVADMKSNPYKDVQGRIWSYGEFFPYDLCPFGYNEGIASEYMPLSEENAKGHGFGWRPPTLSEHKITVKSDELPSISGQAGEEILKEVVSCGLCNKAYRFIKSELDLLNRFGLPLPRSCPECRHKRRFSRINMPDLWERDCFKCGKKIESPYSSDRPEIVYCEQCYQAEVV